MCSVPPETGFCYELAPEEPEEEEVDDPLHAASPAIARIAATSPARRFSTLVSFYEPAAGDP
jgi:hypothetical protein